MNPKNSLKALVLTIVTTVAVMAYVYWNSLQVLEYIRTQPTCFPPYFLMKSESRDLRPLPHPVYGCDERKRDVEVTR